MVARISQKAAWGIWFLAALFYFYEYILRTAPSVMLPELSSYFGISYSGLGFLIGSYFYLYAPLQIAAGILTDIFGEKRILPMAVLLCLIGSFLFILPHYYTALTGRLLIGAGSAFGFVAIIYVATNWIDRKYFSLIVGLTQALGMTGSIIGQVGCLKIVHSFSWKYVWISSSVFGIVLLIFFLFILPGKPSFLNDFYKEGKISRTLENIKLVISNPQTWLASCFGGLIFIPTTVFAMLWGVPFFENVYHMERAQAANNDTGIYWMDCRLPYSRNN